MGLLVTLHWEVDEAQKKLDAANAKLKSVSGLIVADMSKRHTAEVIYFYDHPEEHAEFVRRARESQK